jgi:hypothetical protein
MEILLQVHTTYSCERPGAIRGNYRGQFTIGNPIISAIKA